MTNRALEFDMSHESADYSPSFDGHFEIMTAVFTLNFCKQKIPSKTGGICVFGGTPIVIISMMNAYSPIVILIIG